MGVEIYSHSQTLIKMESNKMRGYCQLELGGKTRTLHFSMNFWAVMEEVSGKTLQELTGLISGGMSITTIRNMVYSGIKTYDLEKGIDVDYSVYDVGMWMEDLEVEHFTLITETILESRIMGADLNAGMRRNIKKSTTNPKQKSL